MSAVLDVPLQSLIERLERAACQVADPFWGEDIDASRIAGLEHMLAAAAAEAQQVRVRAVPELLRLVCAGLEDAIGLTRRVSDQDWQALAVWLVHLAGQCTQSLNTEQRHGLLDELARIDWMPAVAPRMRALILARLAESDSPRPVTAEASDVVSLSEALSAGDPMPPSESWLQGSPTLPGEASTDADLEADAPIWIAAEEAGLAREAIAQQIIPAAQQWWAATSEIERAAATSDIEFHLGLLANALAVLGVPVLATVVNATQGAIRAMDEASSPTAGTLLEWQAALLQFLEQPGAEGAEPLLTLTPVLAPTVDLVALSQELARIRIGINPSLVTAARRCATDDDVRLEIATDAAPGVVAAMLRELPENAARLAVSVQRLVQNGALECLTDAQRYAHTLKGDANAVGLSGLANLTHALEDVLLELGRGDPAHFVSLADVLFGAVDAVGEIADYVLRRGPAPTDLVSQYQALLDLGHALLLQRAGLKSESEPESVAMAEAVLASEAAIVAPRCDALVALSPTNAEPAPSAPPTDLEPMQQVPLRLLKELLRVAGESIVLARQIEQQIKDVGEAQRELQGQNHNNREMVTDLDDLVALRGAALKSARLTSAHELDPLELDQYNELHVISRRLIESNSDQAALVQRVGNDLSRLEELIAAQSRIQGELQRATVRTQSEPVSSITGRLQRVVRQAARQLGKTVELTIEGEDTQVDSEILERMIGALSHLLRNAVDHGIEALELRRACGKHEDGQVCFAVSQESDSVVFRMRDDGCGLDYDAIRQRAIEAGLLEAQTHAADVDLAQLVLLPGFSTRRETTQMSGRGIGMDAVAQTVAELHGTMSLHSESGRGLEVEMRIPASLTAANVVLVRSGSDSVALVTTGVASIVALEPEAFVVEAGARLLVSIDDRVLPAVPLQALFEGARAARRPERRCVGLLVDSPMTNAHVVIVDAVDDVRNVIVKNLEPRLDFPTAVRGVTVLSDGGMAAVVDAPQSIATLMRAGMGERHLTAAAVEDGPRLPRVLIADDSLSVRRALEQLMLDAGFEVATARDGLEALNRLREDPPDVILADLEMPRLNGLDLTRFVRSHATTQTTPVVMITSRATDKYREMAADAGVTQLLGKPYQEDELIGLVRRLIAQANDSERTASEPVRLTA